MPLDITFKTILVPADFTINTEVAVQKALALAGDPHACIYLMHVSRVLPEPVADAWKKLAEWRHRIRATNPGLTINTCIISSRSVEQAIVTTAKEIKADLIIIGKSSHHWLPFLNTVLSSRIAKKTSIPILSVKPGAFNQQIKTVVIPVGKQLSQSKIAVTNALRKKNCIQVCLLAFSGSEDKPHQLPASLLNAYRVFKKSAWNDVSFEISNDHHKGRAVLDYCKKVNADLLIVGQEADTRVGWLNEHITDVMPVTSRTQILAVRYN